MKHVYIIGSKGIPAQYGGFETFVEKLTEKKIADNIKYHIACLGKDNKKFDYNNAQCFSVKVPNIGAAKAIYYDLAALKQAIKNIEANKINDAIIYVLACRIGPFIWKYKNELKKRGIPLIVNPDGHEWKRAKWNWLTRKYWKISEKKMVKHADLLICDSKNIEEYILDEYSKYNPCTKYIAYGAEVKDSKLDLNSEKVRSWFKKNQIKENEYYLVVGRFVPENNYEVMIREFMSSNSVKDFVIITNVESNKFYESLRKKTNFEKDKRIKFVGTVYDQQLLSYIRENAFAYFHGHEVGGTNPSLLEALASTRLNLLLNVGFNKEVAEDGALYWNKENGSLELLIEKAEKMDSVDIEAFKIKARNRIKDHFSWNHIIQEYETTFLNI